VVWIINRVSGRRFQNAERWAVNYPLQVPRDINGSIEVNRTSIQRMTAQMELDYRSSERQARSVAMMSIITAVFIPLSFGASFFGLSFSEMKTPSSTFSKQLLLIPKSNGSMSNLDQILALVGGIMVLLAAVQRTYRSRVDKGEARKTLYEDGAPYSTFQSKIKLG